MAIKTTDSNPRLIETAEMRQVVGLDDTTGFDQHSTLIDRNWAKQAFLISDSSLDSTRDIENRYWSSASAKFTDSRIGGNIGINARPQFTRYADIRVKGRFQDRQDASIGNTTGNLGLGRYYSEAIDDPSQTIYLRFGVPQFNGIFNFLSTAFDPSMTSLAKTGRDTGFLRAVGVAAGTISAFVAFPAIAVTILAGRVLSSFFTRPSSKYYTLKPTMHLYWSTVEMLVNTLAINRGILPKVMADEEQQKIGNPFKIDQTRLTEMNALFPDYISTQNHFNVYGIANRAQRLANKLFVEDFEKLNKGTASDYTGFVETNNAGSHPTPVSDVEGKPTLSAMLNKLLMFGYYTTASEKIEQERLETDPRLSQKDNTSWWSDFVANYDAEIRDGSQYAIFKVDHTGSIGESFGNSVAESDLSSKLNGVSSTARQAKFTFSNGNIFGETGMLSGITDIVGGIADVATGVMSGLTMGVSDSVLGVLGSGYIDIPKYWQSSSATLPRSNYTMTLISPYGNVISQIQNIYLPLCMLLAGSLPLSTGKQSYTSPFLCQIFDRGRSQIRLGMIESLSITRGTSNLAYDLKGNALAIDVSFSVVDLSTIMHMPVSSGSTNPIGVVTDATGLTGSNMTLDEDNILMDYLAVLAGMDMYTQVYPFSKAKLNLSKRIASVQKLTSPAYWSSMIHESATSGMLSYTPIGLFQTVIETGVRGSSVVSDK